MDEGGGTWPLPVHQVSSKTETRGKNKGRGGKVPQQNPVKGTAVRRTCESPTIRGATRILPT